MSVIYTAGNGWVLLAPPVTSPEVDYWGCSASKCWLFFFFFPAAVLHVLWASSLATTSRHGQYSLFRYPLFIQQEELESQPFLAGQDVWVRLRLAGRWDALWRLDINPWAKMR